MSIVLDLFLQDFVNTNKLLGTTYSWNMLVSRRYIDGIPRVFSFTSESQTHHAVGQQMVLPDTDWFRIEVWHPIPKDVEHRFDCLQMMSTATHTEIKVETQPGAVLITLTTRNRGLMNIVFVIRDGPPPSSVFCAVGSTTAIPSLP
jgi:hypothetical protein